MKTETLQEVYVRPHPAVVQLLGFHNNSPALLPWNASVHTWHNTQQSKGLRVLFTSWNNWQHVSYFLIQMTTSTSGQCVHQKTSQWKLQACLRTTKVAIQAGWDPPCVNSENSSETSPVQHRPCTYIQYVSICCVTALFVYSATCHTGAVVWWPQDIRN